MQTFSGLEYLCIDIANCYGLDKELFTTRIQWVKDNFQNLEELADSASEDKILYIKSVKALRDVVAGKPIGHLISLDSTCSGMQILSALTGCKEGARITNLTSEEKRFDAYTEVTDVQNKFLETWGIKGIEILRKDAKRAVMTSLYGSKATPKEVFGEEGPAITAFYESAFTCAPGAFSLLDDLLNSWNAYALSHYWKMPDGFDVAIKVMQTEETRIEVDELNHHKFKTSYKVNLGSRTGISLPANVTHSVDAYVLRSLLRRCSYNASKIKKVILWINSNHGVNSVNTLREDLYEMHLKTGIVDPIWFELITEENVVNVPEHLRIRLIQLANTMLQYKPFDVLTVHDAFRIHPNHGDALRFHYKEILAELAESELLSSIVSQIKGKKVKFKKLSNDLADEIRKSNYAIC